MNRVNTELERERDEGRTAEAILVRRVRAGDTTAFGELVSIYMQRCYYAALGMVGSPQDAEDLSQEAFARAFKARARLDPERPFYPWLYQILRRLCYNFTRDTSSRRRKLERAGGWLVAEATVRAASMPPSSKAFEMAIFPLPQMVRAFWMSSSVICKEQSFFLMGSQGGR